MDGSKTRALPAGLEGVRRQFDRWRQAHQTRSRIPDSLWAAAARAASRCGIHRTSRVLRLDYYALKERVERQATTTTIVAPAAKAVANQQLPSLPAFLELAPSASIGDCECTLELENAAGAKMRVHLKHIAMPDLAALSRSFWNPAT
jgi:hypothetical protein